jgi:hypothetical protein
MVRSGNSKRACSVVECGKRGRESFGYITTVLRQPSSRRFTHGSQPLSLGVNQIETEFSIDSILQDGAVASSIDPMLRALLLKSLPIVFLRPKFSQGKCLDFGSVAIPEDAGALLYGESRRPVIVFYCCSRPVYSASA